MKKTIVDLWNSYLGLVYILDGVIAEHGELPTSFWNLSAEADMRYIAKHRTTIAYISTNKEQIVHNFKELWNGLEEYVIAGNDVSKYGSIESIDKDYLILDFDDFKSNPIPGQPSKQYVLRNLDNCAEIIDDTIIDFYVLTGFFPNTLIANSNTLNLIFQSMSLVDYIEQFEQPVLSVSQVESNGIGNQEQDLGEGNDNQHCLYYRMNAKVPDKIFVLVFDDGLN